MKGKNRSIIGIAGLGILLLLTLLLICTPRFVPAKDGISLSATMNKTSFPLSSQALLRITVVGAQSADIELPEVEKLAFHRRGQSTQVQMTNGSFSSSITYTYAVEALQEGNYSIPPLKAIIKGEEYMTQPLSFKVTAANDRSPQKSKGTGALGADLAFITVSDVKEKSYVGEIMPVKIKAYFRSGIRVEIKTLPEIQGDGFVMSPLSNEPEQNVDSYNGRPYSVISWQAALSPIKEGTFDLRLDLDATLHLPQPSRSRSPRDPFFDDDFFNDDIFDRFFGRTTREQITLKSEPHRVAVLPLPSKGKPEYFSGAVGSFDFSVAAKPTEVNVGEPVTLTMTVSGTGNFDRVAVPTFPENDEWKTYSPSSDFVEQGNSYIGKKMFEQAIVPKNGGTSEIPSIQFSYFDPKDEVYITLSADPIPISVHRGSSTQIAPEHAALPAPQSAPQSAVNTDTTTKLPAVQMRLTPGTFVESIIPVFERSWFIAATILCTCLVIGTLCLFLLRRYREQNSSQLALKQSEKEVAARITALEQRIAADEDHAFLDECRTLMQNRLALSWSMEPSAITGMDLSRRLGADSPLTDLFIKAEQHAYGGLRLTREEMKTSLDVLKKELTRIP